MDCDSEIVAKLLYSNGIPEKWRENPDFYLYINKLGSYTVEQLSKEPDHINTEKTSILNQTQDLAFTNYKTFIHTAECSRKIFHQFHKAEESLDSLIQGVPEFSGKCEEFLNKAKDFKAQRKLNTMYLSKHSSVVQILEVLQLMETVIKEGMYEEALQLAAFVRRLAKSHPNIPILQDMLVEVEKCWWVLVSRLVGQLRNELQLPKCLQLMGHLRRMDVLSQLELKLKFLQARDSWLQAQLQAIPVDDASLHLSKLIELSRTHLFNIITQYKAVFSDEESALPSNRQNFNDIPVLQAWINDKVCEFVDRVEADLKEGVGPALPSLMSQCMYFGQSLSRVGADIRPLLAPIFLRTISKAFLAEMQKARTQFHTDMDKFQVTNANPLVYKLPTEENKQLLSSFAPPSSLLEFYPLSYCCNYILAGLNDLRLCAPLALAQTVTDALQETLLDISNTILHFYQREQQALTAEEKVIFTKFCTCFAEQLLPYIQRCLHAVYPPTEISVFLAVPIHQVQSQGLTFLDLEAVIQPINHMLPPKQIILPSKIQKSTAGTEVSGSETKVSEDEHGNDSSSDNNTLTMATSVDNT